MEGEREELEKKARVLKNSACDAYDKTHDPYWDLGAKLTSEIMVRAVLCSLLKLNLSTPEEISKVLLYLPRHVEYLQE